MALRPEPERGLLSQDTTAEAERIQVEIWRGMSPMQKIALVNQANEDARAIAVAGIRQRYPMASEREQFLRLAELTLGPSLVRAVYADAVAVLGDHP